MLPDIFAPEAESSIQQHIYVYLVSKQYITAVQLESRSCFSVNKSHLEISHLHVYTCFATPAEQKAYPAPEGVGDPLWHPSSAKKYVWIASVSDL